MPQGREEQEEQQGWGDGGRGGGLIGDTILNPLTPGGFPPLQGLRGLRVGQTRGCGWEHLPGTEREGEGGRKPPLLLGLGT